MSARPKPSIFLVGLLLLVLIIDLSAIEAGGMPDLGAVLERILLGLGIGLSLASGALLLITLGAMHRHMRAVEQILGLSLALALGLALTHLFGGCDLAATFSQEGVMLLASASALLTAGGLAFGLLLATVTGRTHPQDPLLEMQSTAPTSPEGRRER